MRASTVRRSAPSVMCVAEAHPLMCVAKPHLARVPGTPPAWPGPSRSWTVAKF